MIDIRYDQIHAAYWKKEYPWYTKPYDLNMFGIRHPNAKADKFDDTIGVAYQDATGNPRIFLMAATTDPGLFYLQNPLSPLGCAILKPGYWKGLWKLGQHKGYNALIQARPCTVIRDANRDGILDFKAGVEETGLFGINFHRFMEGRIIISIQKSGAGCQVAMMDIDQKYVLELVKLQKQYIKSDSVSYALFEESEL